MDSRSISTRLVIHSLLILAPCLALCVSQTQAATVYFSDDFEGVLTEKWEVGGDSWQITDLFYRSDGNCVSDSPKGNYPPNANSTMTMKKMCRVDLSKTIDPVLRFWHRIGLYDGGDHAYVEISEKLGLDGSWKELRSYTNTSRATWSFEQIDLAAYKASPMPVLIRFRLRDDGGSVFLHNQTGDWYWTVGSGWDIDDVAIAEKDTTTLPFPFFDDFESGLLNWMLKEGDAWELTDRAYRDPNHCVSESPNGDYPANACSDLILAHSIDLSSSCFPVLTFWHRIGIGKGDHAYIDISEDGGTSWLPTPLKDYTNSSLATWTLEQLDLSAHKESPILIRFRFRDDGGSVSLHNQTGDWYWTVGSGWDIDDVEIKELIYPPIGCANDLIVQITEIATSNCPTIRAAVTVTDINSVAVSGLKASDFSVYEDDDIRMPIEVEPDSAVVYVALALDYSGSMGPLDGEVITDMRAAAKGFVDLMHPNDWGEVIAFAEGVDIVKEFTNDADALKKGIDRDTTLDRSATWLYDAIYEAISNVANKPGRKAVVVLTDGKDNKSPPGHSATGVINYALANDVPVYTIGLASEVDEVDEAVLTAIAVQTGGMYSYAPDSTELSEIYEKIAGILKNQYIVTYQTGVCPPDGTDYREHELEILVMDNGGYGQGAKRFVCPPECKPPSDE